MPVPKTVLLGFSLLLTLAGSARGQEWYPDTDRDIQIDCKTLDSNFKPDGGSFRMEYQPIIGLSSAPVFFLNTEKVPLLQKALDQCFGTDIRPQESDRRLRGFRVVLPSAGSWFEIEGRSYDAVLIDVPKIDAPGEIRFQLGREVDQERTIRIRCDVTEIWHY
jgi:hypothetical protein